MFSTTTLATIFNNAASDTGYIVILVCTSVVVGMIALMGLGFAIRHVRKILGRKF